MELQGGGFARFPVFFFWIIPKSNTYTSRNSTHSSEATDTIPATKCSSELTTQLNPTHATIFTHWSKPTSPDILVFSTGQTDLASKSGQCSLARQQVRFRFALSVGGWVGEWGANSFCLPWPQLVLFYRLVSTQKEDEPMLCDLVKACRLCYAELLSSIHLKRHR